MTLSPRTPRKGLRRVNRKRKAKNWLRAYGSEARVEFVKALPCIVGVWGDEPCEGEIQNAHVVKGDGGASYKASAEFIAPLCTGHHALLHRVGPITFENAHCLDLAAYAAETNAAWLAHLDGAA